MRFTRASSISPRRPVLRWQVLERSVPLRLVVGTDPQQASVNGKGRIVGRQVVCPGCVLSPEQFERWRWNADPIDQRRAIPIFGRIIQETPHDEKKEGTRPEPTEADLPQADADRAVPGR